MADVKNGKLLCFSNIHFVVHINIGKGKNMPGMLKTVYFNFGYNKTGMSILNEAAPFGDKVITVRQQEGENS